MGGRRGGEEGFVEWCGGGVRDKRDATISLGRSTYFFLYLVVIHTHTHTHIYFALHFVVPPSPPESMVFVRVRPLNPYPNEATRARNGNRSSTIHPRPLPTLSSPVPSTPLPRHTMAAVIKSAEKRSGRG